MSELIGYARVSTRDQDPAAQVEELRAAGCSRIYVDVASGVKASRPEFDRLLDHLRPGDTLVAVRLDRLGRSLRHLVTLYEDLAARRVNLRVLNGVARIDTTTAEGKLLAHFFAMLAEFEAALTRERTDRGLASARARGRNGGRPSVMTAHRIEVARRMYESREHTLKEIAKTIGVGRTTLYHHLNPTRAKDGAKAPAAS